MTNALTDTQRLERAHAILQEIPDPEIPVLTIADLGIVRGVHLQDNTLIVRITPTYTGCPATDMIAMQIRMRLMEAGLGPLKIEQQLSPAWTTDWITETGKRKLEEYGIAAPNPGSDQPAACPQCGSKNTRELSRFGSTPCKALYQCEDCREPFDYFKCH